MWYSKLEIIFTQNRFILFNLSVPTAIQLARGWGKEKGRLIVDLLIVMR